MSTQFRVFSPITGQSQSVASEAEARVLRDQWIADHVANLAPAFSIMKETTDDDGNTVMIAVPL